MKPKGVKFLEVIADKAFLALFLVIFLAVVAMQFIGGGSTVKIANHATPIDRAFDQVVQLAMSKRAQLESPDAAAEAPTGAPEAADRLAGALATPRFSGQTIALGPRITIDLGSSGPGAGEVGRYAPPEAPALTTPLARVYSGALDPYVLRDHPELQASLLGDAGVQPFDIFVVSVQAKFDAAAYRAALQADPDGSGSLSSIPQQWWRSRLEILDVQVERREVRADGARGPTTLLPPTPGVESLRKDIGDSKTVYEFNNLVRLAGAPELARQIRQPPFLRMIAGERWRPPDADTNVKPDPVYVELQGVRKELAKKEQSLEKLQRQALGPVSGQPVVILAAARQPLGGGGGKSREPAKKAGEDRNARRNEQIAKLNEEINNLRAKRDSLIAKLTDAGIDPDTGQRLGPDPALLAPPPRLLTAETAQVWAHDVTAKPGATYEYRMRLVLPNPLKGYAQSLAEDLRDLAAASTITTPPSAWSAPVLVPERSYLFVESAQTPQAGAALGLSRPSATVGLYRFYYGYWRAGRARVAVGDMIAASIEIGAPLPQWDVSGATPTQDGALSGPIVVDPGRYLLDVLTEPSPAPPGPGGREQSRRVVIIGDESGAVRPRRPESDASSPLKERLDTSVRAGKNATIATPQAGDDNQRRPTPAATGRGRDGETPKPAQRPRRGPGLGAPGGGR